VASLSKLRRYWRPLRVIAGFVLLGLAAWVLAGKWSELSGVGAFLAHPRWDWLVLAAAAEVGSFLALAVVERVLIGAGGVRARLGRYTAITFAGNSVQSALPVGAAFAGVYTFRQYRFLGADEVLAGWAVVATGLVAFITITGLAGVGLALAASAGTTFNLFEAIALVLCVDAALIAVWANRAHFYGPMARAVTTAERWLHRTPGQLQDPLRKGLERMRSVAPSRQQWFQAWVAGAATWVSDLSCLGLSFLAVGAGVPWRGLLLAYCAAQLATLLPVTPGGLGVVEGSLTVALVAFGGGRVTTVAAVLLYRLLGFWLPLPVGAGCYLALARVRRREHRASGQQTERAS